MRSNLTIILLVIALVSIGAWSSQGQTEKVKSVSYEYHVMLDPTALLGMDAGLQQLNKVGSHGWELAGVVQQKNAASLLYFKRVKKVD